MGWSSGTSIFDVVAKEILSDTPLDKKRLLKILIEELEDHDWDCVCESEFYEHPMVDEIVRELHPDWNEDDE